MGNILQLKLNISICTGHRRLVLVTKFLLDCLNMTVIQSEAVSQKNGKTCVTIPQSVTYVTPVVELTLQPICWTKVQNNSVSDLRFTRFKCRKFQQRLFVISL